MDIVFIVLGNKNIYFYVIIIALFPPETLPNRSLWLLRLVERNRSQQQRQDAREAQATAHDQRCRSLARHAIYDIYPWYNLEACWRSFQQPILDPYLRLDHYLPWFFTPV